MKLGDKKVRLLKDLEITEVSLVTSAANKGAKVLFYKMDKSDFNKLNSLSVEKLTAAMQSVDYKKLGVSPEELWEDYVAEVMENHNTELAQRQKHPPEKLSTEEVKELRQRKPWTREQAAAAARKTNIGQGLWAMVESCVREREAALIKRLDKMGEELEESKKRAQETIEMYDRIKRERTTKMETIEEITAAAVEGHFADKHKAWEAVEKLLKSQVAKSDTGMGFNQSLLLAMSKPSWNAFYEAYSGLPEAQRKVEIEEKRPVGKAMKEISRRAEEMVQKGLVGSFEKGVVRVTEIYPELAEQHDQEMYG